MSSDKDVKAAVDTVQGKLQEEGKQLATKASTPLPTTYRPELDVSPELPPEGATYYQNLIGILR